MTTDCTAWVLNLGDGLWAAVGEFELAHVIPYSPVLFEIPWCPLYCRQALIWEDEVLPVIDLGERLLGEVTRRGEARAGVGAEIETLVGVVAYSTRPGDAPKHGGLLMREVPSRVRVSDRQACALPEQGSPRSPAGEGSSRPWPGEHPSGNRAAAPRAFWRA